MHSAEKNTNFLLLGEWIVWNVEMHQDIDTGLNKNNIYPFLFSKKGRTVF